VSVPAYRWIRSLKDKAPMKPINWLFVGSRVMEDGKYAADVTGYVISVVNFDLTLIDIPEIASNSTRRSSGSGIRMWPRPGGTRVVMVIEPAGNAGDRAGPGRGGSGDQGVFG
jgi:hypothetical protein